jgi:hypothetical protein
MKNKEPQARKTIPNALGSTILIGSTKERTRLPVKHKTMNRDGRSTLTEPSSSTASATSFHLTARNELRGNSNLNRRSGYDCVCTPLHPYTWSQIQGSLLRCTNSKLIRQIEFNVTFHRPSYEECLSQYQLTESECVLISLRRLRQSFPP